MCIFEKLLKSRKCFPMCSSSIHPSIHPLCRFPSFSNSLPSPSSFALAPSFTPTSSLDRYFHSIPATPTFSQYVPLFAKHQLRSSVAVSRMMWYTLTMSRSREYLAEGDNRAADCTCRFGGVAGGPGCRRSAPSSDSGRICP